MAKTHGAQLDDRAPARPKGGSKENTARTANVGPRSAARSTPAGKAPAYDEMSRDDLYKRAREADIGGRSKMSKNELIRALRND